MQGMRLVVAMAAALFALGSGVAFAEPEDLTSDQSTGSGSQVDPGSEVVADRTATSQTFSLPNGELETRIYSKPVNYRDEEGSWQPIGERLREADEETLTNGPNTFDVTLPKQIDSKPVRFEVGDNWVESQLLRKDLEGADLEGAIATYEGEGNAPSFEFTGLSNGLKEDIELSGPDQANRFTYELSASDGLVPSLANDGSIRFLDSDGTAVVVLPPPVMSDSASEPAVSRSVHYELGAEEDGHWKLSVIAEREWLEDPARVWPVRIDPTMTTGPALDCVIGGHKGETGWIDCAAWGRQTLLAGYTPKLNSAEDNWWRTLMNLETSGVPATAQVSSAIFHVRSTETAQNTKGVELRKITKPWTWQASWSRYDGSEHLWSSEGGDYSDLLGEVLTSKRGSQAGWWEFSLPTNAVEDEATEGTDLPVLMKLIDDKVRECSETSCTNRQVTFDSSAAKTESNRPYLSVVYTMPSSETPIAEYSFNEGSGEVAHDGSGHGHDATLHGAEWTGEGRFGGALFFDGEADLATVPSSRELELSNALTLEAWVKPEEDDEWGVILAKEAPGFASYGLLTQGEGAPAGFVFDGKEEETTVEGVSPISPEAWSYLALTSNGKWLRLYVDGELVGSMPAAQGAGGKGPLQIGGELLWGEESAFKGSIDDIRIYNRALSVSEVEQDESLPVGVQAPAVMTEAASEVKGTEATLKGLVNPNGAETSYQFEYGLTTSYGSVAPTSAESAGSGKSNVAVSKAISGLKANTTYHYRASATNAYVKTVGEDKTFTTLKMPSATTEAASGVKEREATLKGSVNPNGISTTYQFEYGTTTAYGSKVPASPASAGSGAIAVAVSRAITGLEEGVAYHYRVVASSAAGTVAGSDQTLKTIHPPQTTITSATPTYTNHEESWVIYKSDQTGSTFRCGFDEGETPTKACSTSYGLPKHLKGWHTFVVAAVNSEGQADQTPAKWTFNTEGYLAAPSTSKLTSPEEGKQTSHYYTLKADWKGEVTGVTFQLKLPAWEEFKTIPAEYALDGKGKKVTWPFKVSGESTYAEPIYFDFLSAAHANLWNTDDETVKLRALFDGDKSAAGVSEPMTTTFSDKHGIGASSDAIETLGPVTLDLVSGQYTISRTDVSIPVPGSESNLEFTRVYSSRPAAHVPTRTLGYEWQPSVPVEQEAEGAAWSELIERHEDAVPPVEEEECWLEGGHSVCERWVAEEEIPAADWVEVLDNEGAGLSFEVVGGQYMAPEEAKEFVLTKEGSTFALAGPEGTRTSFVQNGAGSTSYRPTSVSWQATAKSARMVYEWISGINQYRLIKMVAPTMAGIECPDQKAGTSEQMAGCRALTFQYTKGKEAIEDRLSSISYYNGTNPGVKVAEYAYNGMLHLQAEWDPRVSPALKETYTYSTPQGAGALTMLTPPGEEPWEISDYGESDVGVKHENGGYGCAWAECELLGRLKSVSRASLLESPEAATTTVAYQVPLRGKSAPYEMSPEAIADWGQTDYPIEAVAIFPPTQVPGGAHPTDFSEATIHYLDPSGYQTNTASPSPPGVEGDSISTSENDLHGNVVRELSAQNRLEAFEAEDSVARSHELDSHSTFSADGTEMLESWGPLHSVRLESGETVEARAHSVTEYDKGAPTPKEGEAAPHLPTKEISGAAIPGKEGDLEQRVTETKYDWGLKKPTETIADSGGLGLRTRIAYDASTGMPTERSMPAKPEGGDAHTTKTVFYTALANAQDSSCGYNAPYAGLPCKTLLASQPGTAGQPDLLVTRYAKYNGLDEPTEMIESPGGNEDKRTTVKTYDAVGRSVTSGQVGGGKGLPATQTVYDELTGAPIEQKFTCECGSGFAYSSSFGEFGTAAGQFDHPADVTVDAKGNLWVVDKANNRIEQFSEEGGSPKAFGSLGSTGGKLKSPSGITVDSSGNVWVTDTGNTRVVEFSEEGEFLATFGTNVNKTKVESGGTQAEKNLCTAASGNICQAGAQGSLEGQMREPMGIASSGGNLFVVEKGNHRVDKFSPTGAALASFGKLGNNEGQFNRPTSIAVAPDGSIWVADTNNDRIEQWDSGLSFVRAVGKKGSGNGEFKDPDAIEVDSAGNVLVADQDSNRVQKFSSSGTFIARFGASEPGPGQFSFSDPVGIVVQGNGTVWITDPGHNQIQQWVPSAAFDDQALVMAYDELGRPVQYTDADGNTSKTSYDLLGRPATIYDGKGTQTFGYDETSGLLVAMNDSAAGVFTASYDADGKMIQEGLPNGLVARTTYDEAGAPTKRSYTKVISCSEKMHLDRRNQRTLDPRPDPVSDQPHD